MACSSRAKARVSSFASWAAAARCTSAWARAASKGEGATGNATLVRGSGGWTGAVATVADGATGGGDVAALGRVGTEARGGGVLSEGMEGVSVDAMIGASGGGSDTEGSGLS